MGWSLGWARMAMTGIAAVGMVVGEGALAPGAAQSAPAVGYGRTVSVAPGVFYRSFTVTASHGLTRGHLVVADLGNPHVRVDLLTPGAVAAYRAGRAPEAADWAMRPLPTAMPRLLAATAILEPMPVPACGAAATCWLVDA